MTPWSCTIPGQPVGKGRPRFVGPRLGRKARAFTPSRTRAWEASAALWLRSAWRAAPADGPVTLRIVAVLARPQRLMRAREPDGRLPHTTKPDADNVAKAVGDALQAAGVVGDDSQVVGLEVVKLYAAKGEDPHVLVELRAWRAT